MLAGPNIWPHYVSITLAPLHFKCNYICHNLCGLTWYLVQYKMLSYQYRKSHCGDKTILRPSYLHNGFSYAGKTTSLYWIRALNIQGIRVKYRTNGNCNIPATESRLWGTKWYTCLVPKFACCIAGPLEFFIQWFSMERSRTASPGAVLQMAISLFHFHEIVVNCNLWSLWSGSGYINLCTFRHKGLRRIQLKSRTIQKKYGHPGLSPRVVRWPIQHFGFCAAL